ncbi:MAG: hypothetical protein F6K04_00930 [Leptolyngbya sp. SIO4C5]|nr:hypothetical protein [Leptolyngbya sp. SIO4C5]
MIDSLLLAQQGSQAAVDVITNALQLTEDTIASWNETWIDVVDPNSQLWGDVVEFSRGLLALCFLYMFVRYGNELMKSKYLGTIVEIFTFPLIVLLFLGSDGQLLANSILFVRSLGYQLVTGLLSKQLVGYQMQDAVTQFGLNNLGVQRIKQVYSECEELVGDPFLECWDSKAPEVQAIYDQLQAQNPGIDLGPLQSFADMALNFSAAGTIRDIGTAAGGVISGDISGAFASIIQDRLLPIIQSILYAVQWAFVNLVEASLLIAAVFAPIALVLSILPTSGRPIWAWASGFVGLLGLQIGYNLIVGIVAVVLANTRGGAIEVSQNLGFLLFISVFAPALATFISSWSATTLYASISRRANSIASAVTGGISTAARFAVLRK